MLFAVLFAGLLVPQPAFAQNGANIASMGWKYNFCWANPNLVKGKPVFSGAPYTTSSMTIETCLNYCRSTTSGGPFNYAGLQNGNQCYCGGSTFEDRADLSDTYCNVPCAGNSNEFCGGPTSVGIYAYQNSRTPSYADLTYDSLDLHGCYNTSTVYAYRNDGFPMIDHHEFPAYCFYVCAFNDDDTQRTDFHGFSIGSQTGPTYEPECLCHYTFDYSVKPGPISECALTICGGDPGQFCGGQGRYLMYSDTRNKDLDSASKATSKSLWASSITAASISHSSARASVSASKQSAANSRSTARTSVAASQASASTSRSSARSTVSASKQKASASRSTARSSASSSKIAASTSRSSARSSVSQSQSGASLSRSQARQSQSASRSSYQSRYTSSSLSKASANAAYSTASSSSASSRSSAQSRYTSSSRAAYTSKSLASSSKSLSRSYAASSQSVVNNAGASSRSSASRSRASQSQSQSLSQQSASLSRSFVYSSLSWSAHQASLTKSAYYSSVSAASATRTTTTIQGRYGQIITVTTTIVVSSTSSDTTSADSSISEAPSSTDTTFMTITETTTFSVEATSSA